LAQSLGVTTDELLTDIKAEKDDPKPKEAKVFGLTGMAIETPEEYEFISDKRSKKDLPFLHIHVGKQVQTINAKARGVIAIGNNAKGLISIGLFSAGLVSIGIVSLGLLSFSVFAIGLIACGTIAIGCLAMGAIAIGYVSIGALVIGYYAHTGTLGYGVGKHIFVHKFNYLINQ
jgi:hypothetical protein